MIPIDGNNDIDKKVVRRLKKIALIYLKDRPASGHLWLKKNMPSILRALLLFTEGSH